MDKQIEVYGIRSIIEAIDASKEISKVYLIKSASTSSLFRSLINKLEKNNIKFAFVPKEKLKLARDICWENKLIEKIKVSSFSVEIPIK